MRPPLLRYEIVSPAGGRTPYDPADPALYRDGSCETAAAKRMRQAPDGHGMRADAVFAGYRFKRFAVHNDGTEVLRWHYFKVRDPARDDSGDPRIAAAGLVEPRLVLMAGTYFAPMFRAVNHLLREYERDGREHDVFSADFDHVRRAYGYGSLLPDLRAALPGAAETDMRGTEI